MKTNHTPGPWHNFGPIIHKKGQHIASLSKNGNFNDEDKANASLIAASPELLQRLIESNDVLNLILSNPANNLSEIEMRLIGVTLEENETVISGLS